MILPLNYAPPYITSRAEPTAKPLSKPKEKIPFVTSFVNNTSDSSPDGFFKIYFPNTEF